jgi:methylmalonyl-CoA/ethylmalonyl-CoA epimerase
MEFHHAGIATTEFDELAALYQQVFDTPVVHEETFEGLRIGFLALGDGYFELLEPVDEDTTIARYLDRNGPGLHHVALRTDDVSAALATAEAADVALIDTEPRAGAWGHDVAFLHPDTTGGMLVEFVEP